MVPLINILTLVAMLVLSVLLPVSVWFIVWRRTKASPVNLLVGMAVFFVCFVIAVATSLLGSMLIASPLILTLVLALRAGLVEEFGRFVAFKWLLKRQKNISDGIMYGIGHGGMEVLLVYSLAIVSNLVLVFMASTGALEPLYAEVPEQAAAISGAIDAIAQSSPLTLSIGLFERVSALTLHISLSVIVFCAVRQKRWALFVLAIAMHALSDSTIALLVTGVVNIPVLEVIIFGVSLLTVFLAWLTARAYRKTQQAEQAEQAPMTEQLPS